MLNEMIQSKLSSIPPIRTLRTGFILFLVVHLNLAMPVGRASDRGDLCITDNGIHMAHHSDNQRVHNHIGEMNNSGYKKGIHEMRMDCNMDISLNDIYFPGGEHPFTSSVTHALDSDLFNREDVSFLQTKITEGFLIPPDNPPKPVVSYL